MPLTIHPITAADRDFAHCLKIRIAVFVEEQDVPLSEEQDAHDATALHFLAAQDDCPIATARVLFKDAGATAKIGRVAVLAAGRGQGIGTQLMRAIETSPKLSAVTTFILDAQCHAEHFYHALGYTPTGPEFMENNIPHIHMQKRRG